MKPAALSLLLLSLTFKSFFASDSGDTSSSEDTDSTDAEELKTMLLDDDILKEVKDSTIDDLHSKLIKIFAKTEKCPDGIPDVLAEYVDELFKSWFETDPQKLFILTDVLYEDAIKVLKVIASNTHYWNCIKQKIKSENDARKIFRYAVATGANNEYFSSLSNSVVQNPIIFEELMEDPNIDSLKFDISAGFDIDSLKFNRSAGIGLLWNAYHYYKDMTAFITLFKKHQGRFSENSDILPSQYIKLYQLLARTDLNKDIKTFLENIEKEQKINTK